MCEELVREDGCVGMDLYEVDGYCRDLGEHRSSQRVGQGEGRVTKDKVDRGFGCLEAWLATSDGTMSVVLKAHMSDRDTGTGVIGVHVVVWFVGHVGDSRVKRWPNRSGIAQTHAKMLELRRALGKSRRLEGKICVESER